MAEITVSKLGKSFGANEIFSDVSFHIDKNDKVGIVGPNGAGKTSLFNILSEKDDDYQGNIYIKNGLKIGYMLQNISLSSSKTIFEEMLEVFSYIHDLEKELKDLEEKLNDHSDLENLEANTIKYTEKLDKYTDLGGQYFENKIESVLVGMGFSKDRFDDKIDHLSGGEKTRNE